MNKKKVIIVGLICASIVALVIVIISSGGGSSPVATDLKLDSLEVQSEAQTSPVAGDGDYEIEETLQHVGEKAVVNGNVNRVFKSKSGTVFLDFCEDYESCPFSAVIFAGDVKKFDNVEKLVGRIAIEGVIKTYNGKAEIVLKDPKQIR